MSEQNTTAQGNPMDFPDDENGRVLRQMCGEGDDLVTPRTIDFFFVFNTRASALAFAAIIEDPDLAVCISYYHARGMWQATVQRRMVPSHNEITSLESALTQKS